MSVIVWIEGVDSRIVLLKVYFWNGGEMVDECGLWVSEGFCGGVLVFDEVWRCIVEGVSFLLIVGSLRVEDDSSIVVE